MSQLRYDPVHDNDHPNNNNNNNNNVNINNNINTPLSAVSKPQESQFQQQQQQQQIKATVPHNNQFSSQVHPPIISNVNTNSINSVVNNNSNNSNSNKFSISSLLTNDDNNNNNNNNQNNDDTVLNNITANTTIINNTNNTTIDEESQLASQSQVLPAESNINTPSRPLYGIHTDVHQDQNQDQYPPIDDSNTSTPANTTNGSVPSADQIGSTPSKRVLLSHKRKHKEPNSTKENQQHSKKKRKSVSSASDDVGVKDVGVKDEQVASSAASSALSSAAAAALPAAPGSVSIPVSSTTGGTITASTSPSKDENARSPAVNSRTRHIKKKDSEPLWRSDIQFEFFKNLLCNNEKVFTNPFGTIDEEIIYWDELNKGLDPNKDFSPPEVPITENNDNDNNINNSTGLQSKGYSGKLTFFELYLLSILKSSKISKILKERLALDLNYAFKFIILCLLVNFGRLNTTINFDYEMRSQLRTYHCIPVLQVNDNILKLSKTYNAGNVETDTVQHDSEVAVSEFGTPMPSNLGGGSGYTANTVKQLQDTPRLKTILKSINDLNAEIPSGSYKEFTESLIKTNTEFQNLLASHLSDSNDAKNADTIGLSLKFNLISLIFLISNYEDPISEQFFPDRRSILDGNKEKTDEMEDAKLKKKKITFSIANEIFLNDKVKPENKAKRFLWLAFKLSETDLTEDTELSNNPFGDKNIDGENKIPPVEYIENDEVYDRDTETELAFAEQMKLKRKAFLEAVDNFSDAESNVVNNNDGTGVNGTSSSAKAKATKKGRKKRMPLNENGTNNKNNSSIKSEANDELTVADGEANSNGNATKSAKSSRATKTETNADVIVEADDGGEVDVNTSTSANTDSGHIVLDKRGRVVDRSNLPPGIKLTKDGRIKQKPGKKPRSETSRQATPAILHQNNEEDSNRSDNDDADYFEELETVYAKTQLKSVRDKIKNKVLTNFIKDYIKLKQEYYYNKRSKLGNSKYFFNHDIHENDIITKDCVGIIESLLLFQNFENDLAKVSSIKLENKPTMAVTVPETVSSVKAESANTTTFPKNKELISEDVTEDESEAYKTGKASNEETAEVKKNQEPQETQQPQQPQESQEPQEDTPQTKDKAHSTSTSTNKESKFQDFGEFKKSYFSLLFKLQKNQQLQKKILHANNSELSFLNNIFDDIKKH
ncbi:hypothetical protein PACTADRAFT_3286 [Pachysolen tannophilus NRRL Y-2460]|uniref:Ino eighty subunit 1 n=1 Tax=Pachysolen tannophilus NRRL Y-2460 TaxID=669874 RepID=A0A1E4TV03_PACTA|nr:hypothetical protein PACTADRAFT_3286 [Pachysolen tannophilus NRRL Y-2460]